MSNRSNPLPLARSLSEALGLVCSLPSESREARRIDVQTLMTHAIAHRELDAGVAVTFPNTDDLAQSILDLVLAERNCCAQFRYTIVFDAAHQPIEVRIEGPGSLVASIKALYRGLAAETSSNVEA